MRNIAKNFDILVTQLERPT